MYDRVLVPLDGSELAEGALPYVEGIAGKLGSEAILVTACAQGDPLELPYKAYLDSKATDLEASGIRTSSLCIEGDVAVAILDYAERMGISMIIISTHGRTGVSRWPLGSIASKVLQNSRIPVLLIRSMELERVAVEKELRRILVPLDGSKFAENIIPYVENLAGRAGSQVILLRVLEPILLPPITRYGVSAGDEEEFEKDVAAKAEKMGRRYLDEKEGALRTSVAEVNSVLLQGKPAETILRYAQDNDVSLIALATHGFSGISKWAFGSVASKLIEGSTTPVLVVRPPLPGAGSWMTGEGGRG
jgi:nucleotide-binding universal stress UspA family protein